VADKRVVARPLRNLSNLPEMLNISGVVKIWNKIRRSLRSSFSTRCFSYSALVNIAYLQISSMAQYSFQDVKQTNFTFKTLYRKIKCLKVGRKNHADWSTPAMRNIDFAFYVLQTEILRNCHIMYKALSRYLLNLLSS
jgi:hypothetical protein